MSGLILCDIDGVLLEHKGSLSIQTLDEEPSLLPGTLEKLDEWDRRSYKIILTTGRRESLRSKTENDLRRLGIFYDQLVMGCGRGPRYLINDMKKGSNSPTAIGISLPRNKGIADVQLD